MAEGFFNRHYKYALFLVALLIVYVANHYSMNAKLKRMDTLRKEVTEQRYELLIQQSALMQESRESHIRKLVEERGLELKSTDQPPYHLKVKKHGK